MRSSEEIFRFHENELIDIYDMMGFLRMNVIEYTCSFAKIDPFRMAAQLVKDGYGNIKFDDASISCKENERKRRRVYGN